MAARSGTACHGTFRGRRKRLHRFLGSGGVRLAPKMAKFTRTRHAHEGGAALSHSCGHGKLPARGRDVAAARAPRRRRDPGAVEHPRNPALPSELILMVLRASPPSSAPSLSMPAKGRAISQAEASAGMMAREMDRRPRRGRVAPSRASRGARPPHGRRGAGQSRRNPIATLGRASSHRLEARAGPRTTNLSGEFERPPRQPGKLRRRIQQSPEGCCRGRGREAISRVVRSRSVMASRPPPTRPFADRAGPLALRRSRGKHVSRTTASC
jgi:hypothetical protein